MANLMNEDIKNSVDKLEHRIAMPTQKRSRPEMYLTAFMLGVALSFAAVPTASSQTLSERVSKLEGLDALTARGVVMPNAEVTFSSDITALVDRSPVKAGDVFKKGDLLVGFDCGKFDAELRGSKALEGKQLLSLNNKEKLKLRNAASAFEVAVARADFEIAKAQTDALKQVMRFCVITAPFDGRVLELHADKYEMLGANSPLLTVVDDSILELDLIVPSKWLRWLTIGTKFNFEVEETGKVYLASIVRVGAKIDAVSQTIKITGKFKKRPVRVLPGMSGAARFDPPTQ